MKIVVTQAIPKESLAELLARHTVIYPENGSFEPLELAALAADADALLSVFSQTIDEALIGHARKLRIIANYGVGFNNIYMQMANQRQILVTNTPDVVTEPTAELALGMMIALARRVAELDRAMRGPNPPRPGLMVNLGTGLAGKTLGIVGLGKIGESVARKAKVFGMEILYHKRQRLDPERERQLGIRFVPFDELLRQSDLLSLHLPLNKDSYHLLSLNEFRMMKPTAFLINTARGPIVDEAALVEALRLGLIGGAALDVFENEPEVHPGLLDRDEVLLLPHVGTATHATRVSMGQRAARNLLDYFDGRRPADLVNPEVWDALRSNRVQT